MSFFLLTFDKQSEAAPEIARFEDAQGAMSAFVEAERALRGDDRRGVVLLVAEDEDTLRRTHSHYFASVDEILSTT
ncbi:MAG TPA: hypothetical protein VHC01_05020 [Gaiellaceae bacterium]|jgi:hypothetical protein|nr:hypothetical protein [Gaiellaceae bacterium]